MFTGRVYKSSLRIVFKGRIYQVEFAGRAYCSSIWVKLTDRVCRVCLCVKFTSRVYRSSLEVELVKFMNRV